jgi:hypothetical protein
MEQSAANVTVIVSNRFVRYALVPWSDELSTPREELAFALHVFAGTYGDASDNWELRLSPARRGEQRVASAVDRELLEAIRAAFADTRLRLHSIQPYLMAVHNLCRPIQHGQDCLFLIVENCFYTCAAFRTGKWRSVRSGIITGALGEALPAILDRERVWSGFAHRPSVLVYTPEQPGLDLSPDQPWSVECVQLQPRYGFSPTSDAQYAMAMSAE